MKSSTQSLLASVLTLLAGVWVAFMPTYIKMSHAADINTIIVGSLIALAGLVQAFWKNVFPSWVSILASVYLFVSAFVYNTNAAGRWNVVAAAIATFILATWDGLEVSDVRHHHVTA